MDKVREATETSAASLPFTSAVVPACALTRPRHAFVARPWHGPLMATMPSLGEGPDKELESILANGTLRLKEPST